MPEIPCSRCGGLFHVKPSRLARSTIIYCSERCRWDASDIALPNPAGLCGCGCGAATPIAVQTCRRFGWVAGQHLRYVLGHSNRGRFIKPLRYVEEDRGYETPCWIWQLKLNDKGYGIWKIDGKQRLAHRVYFERRSGPVPQGFELDHLCRVTSCVNPSHLEAVTHAENMRRGIGRKLTPEQVHEICAAHGVPLKELAERYGIAAKYACALRTGKAKPAFANEGP